jgi:hypothetical protein
MKKEDSEYKEENKQPLDKRFLHISGIDFENLESIKKLINDVGAEIAARGFFFIQKNKNGERVTDEELFIQKQLCDQLRFLETAWSRLKRTKCVSGREDMQTEQDVNFLEKVKQRHSAIGSIVRDMTEKAPDHGI